VLRRAWLAAPLLSLALIPAFGARAERQQTAQQPQTAPLQTAQAFLESIYLPYRQRGFKGQPYTDFERFFAPDLARAMKRESDYAKRRGEPPIINGDPFVDAQDWQITDLVVRATGSGDKATGVVSFSNQGKPKRLALELVRTEAGWRIADIAGAGGSLRALYKVR
jgi:hypothetical protein